MTQGTPTAGGYRYTVLVMHEDDGWTAHVPALGIATQGDDVDHTFEMAQEMIEGWLETVLEMGMEIPAEDEVHVRRLEARPAVPAWPSDGIP